jgi:hypothetical protein
MFPSDQLTTLRADDGSYHFKIKLEASIYAEEVSFQPITNVARTLEDLNSRLTEDFSQLTVIGKLLKEQIQNLKDALASHTRKILNVFELGGTPNCHGSEFDPEGDGDILEINFGGKNVEIQRSCLTKPVIGWNLFSCLFEKRWDRFHVRDRTGRIYIDWKEEWMRPLIEYMKYNKSSNNPIKSVDVFLRDIMETLSFDEKFLLHDLIPSVSWVGLELSQLFGEVRHSEDACRCRRNSIFIFPCIPTYFEEIYSSPKPLPKATSLQTDIRFKPIFCLYKTADGILFAIFINWTIAPFASLSWNADVQGYMETLPP